MAFPYLLEGGFETGASDFDGSLTDTQSKSLGYLHYSDSIRKYGVAPFRGAYLWGIDQSVGTKTTGCYLTQTTLDVANTYGWAIGLALYVKSNNVMGDGDRTTIACGTSGVQQGTIELYYTTAAGLQIHFNKTSGTAVGSGKSASLTMDEWHWVEIRGIVQTGGTGTLKGFLDGNQVGATITGLTNVALTDGIVGVFDAEATHTAGQIFIDSVIMDTDGSTAEVACGYPWPRYPFYTNVTKTGHVFVGPGTLQAASLISVTAADEMKIFDTDRAYSTAAPQNCIVDLVVGAAGELGGLHHVEGPIAFYRGCYVVLSGTNPRGTVRAHISPPAGYPGLLVTSEYAIKDYALRKRKELIGNM